MVATEVNGPNGLRRFGVGTLFGGTRHRYFSCPGGSRTRTTMSQLRLRSRTAVFRVASALLAWLVVSPLCAQNTDFAILYHERVQAFSSAEDRMRPQALGGAPSYAPPLSFVAFGRPFDIDLRRNDRLTRTLDASVLEKLGRIDV